VGCSSDGAVGARRLPVSETDGTDRPATFREVLAVGEYRALYLASTLSWFGDYVARAAVTALVYQRT